MGETRSIDGSAGAIEVAIDRPAGEPVGVALVAHPHPLFGGSNENKVVQTLARALVSLGYLALRPNFRGVGDSAGQFDHGDGEHLDLIAVLEAIKPLVPGPLVLAGFSFGAFVQTRVADTLKRQGEAPSFMILVGLAVTNFSPPPVPEETLLIHGEQDDTVPLSAVLDWARPLDLTVTVVPGADHFFHRRLMIIKRVVLAAMSGRSRLAHDQNA